MAKAPQNPAKLVGSKWTASLVDHRRRHWVVVEHHARAGAVVLRAVLDHHRLKIPWRQLRDRDQWQPGWV